MVHDTITLEGHLIDSDIMRRVFDRVVEEGGEFEVQEFRVGRTQRRALLRAGRDPDRGPARARPDPRGGALPRGDHRGRRLRLRPRGGGRDPARRVLLHDELRHPRAHRGPLGGGARPEDGLRARAARRRAVLRQAGAGEAGRAGGAARHRHPGAARSSAAATTRSSASCRTTSPPRSTRASSIRAAAREMKRVRAAGERIVVVPGPAVVHSGGEVALARARARGVGGRDPHRERVRRARPREGDRGHEPRRVPDERPGGGGRQPQPPLRDQRREPRWGASARRWRAAS